MSKTLIEKLYQEKVAPALMEKFKYENKTLIPKLQKVVVHVGTGTRSGYNVDAVSENLQKITGQIPVKTLGKKSISNFKLRQGQIIGLKVTLRGKRMYQFIERLIHITLPRVHDFRGLPLKAFDKNGNLTIGLGDQLAFPEIIAESIEQLHGLEITIVNSAKTEQEGIELFNQLGFPIQGQKLVAESGK